MVALLAEGVDRNITRSSCSWWPFVALLAEGVDRNLGVLVLDAALPDVALLAEGVDRNKMSALTPVAARIVALLAEGVDRNRSSRPAAPLPGQSPSSRRAWIEITSFGGKGARITSRPPRGGRG